MSMSEIDDKEATAFRKPVCESAQGVGREVGVGVGQVSR